MPRWLLALLLTVSALIAATPSLYWLAGRWINIVDERFMELLGASATTVPIGLFLASIVLSIHGVLYNRRLAEDVADHLAEEYLQAGMVPLDDEDAELVGAGARSAKAEQPGSGGKAKKGAAKTAKRTKRRVQSRGKSVARREMRKVMPRI